jgi:NAD(P)-dependent dehydrogenase (short-subunit alcohol dehydrogenase family)
MNIEGSGALVAGGASGLGAATARLLAERGAAVTIADVDAEHGEALADQIGARFAQCDVRYEEQVQAAVEMAHQAPGGLRISVCSAGVAVGQRTTSSKGPHELEAFSRVIAINLVGTFNVLRLAATAMRDNDPGEGGERGVCVNTASIAAYEGQIGQIAYSASKGGVVGMTLPAARDLAQYGVRVATIAPGLFDTPLLAMVPPENREALGRSIPFPSRLGTAAEYAHLVTAIVENPMLNGEVIRLDGALRMAPR